MTRNLQHKETEYFSSFYSLKFFSNDVLGSLLGRSVVWRPQKRLRSRLDHLQGIVKRTCRSDYVTVQRWPFAMIPIVTQTKWKHCHCVEQRWKIILHRLVDLTIWMTSVGAQERLYSKPFRNKAKTFAAVVMNQNCYRIRLTLLGNCCSRLQVVRSVVQAK